MTRNHISRRSTTIAIATFAFGGALPARAQTWPDRPITIVMPYAAGGPTDVAVRDIARKMSEVLGQSVIVDNKPGGGAMIGAQLVARAKADGYTLLIPVVANMVTGPLLGRSANYDPLKSFTPVSLLSANPLLLVASKASDIKTFQDVLRVAREKPGKLAIASYGLGTPSHLAIELLKSTAKIDVIHVPYNGSSPAMTDVLSGRVPLMMDILPSQIQTMKSGAVRGIALGQKNRSALAPEVPTFDEVGLSGFEASTWFGLSAPVGTPPSVIARLNKAVRHAMADQELQKNMLARGVEVQASTPEEFDAIIRGDFAKWGKVIKDAGIKID